MKRSLWVLILALIVSVLGHFFLLFGSRFLHIGTPTEVPEELIIKTELRPEAPQKIQLTKAPKKPIPSNSSVASTVNANADKSGAQGALLNQKGQAFRLPESAILYYDAYVDGQLYQRGQIDWIVQGNNYRLHVNIPYAFIGPFVYESIGSIDSYGLAPTIYWAKRGSNPPRYSRFDRGLNESESNTGKMFFSEKPEFTPDIIPGTQDRFSLMFQFAALLNGSDKIDEAGSIRSVPVVDYNSLEMWQFKSYGESISDDIPSLGKSANRHYALLQRENDPYKRQVDLWLARDLDWLPGKIRSQESNGRVLELVFKQKAPISPD